MRKCFLLSAFVFAAMTAAGSARADVPPPGNVKGVTYTFAVRGLAVAPDRLVFGYPCSTWSTPDTRLLVVEEGKASKVDRRDGECALYATTKAAYDAWRQTYAQQGDRSHDPQIEKLVSTSTKCTGDTLYFARYARADDPHEAIDEVFDTKKLDASGCEIVSTNRASMPVLPDEDEATSTPSSSLSQTRPSSDDGGCSVGRVANGAGPWLLALGVPALVFLGARRRRNEKKQ